MDDLEVLFILGPLVLLIAMACETAWRNRYIPQWVARKLLHVVAIGACALAPLWLDDLGPLRWIVVGSEILLIILISKGYFIDHKNGRPSWGIVLFPPAYLVLLFLEPDRWLIALPMAILALSDAMAAAIGGMTSDEGYRLTADPKSFPGSVAFLVTTLALLINFPSFMAVLQPLTLGYRWSLLLSLCLLITAIEALGSRGLDNFFIPLTAWLLFAHLADLPEFHLMELASRIGIGSIMALIFVPVMIRMKWLSPGGAIAAAVVGLWVLFFAGVHWLLPLFIFLIGSTIIGRTMRHRAILSADRKVGRPRDAVQVLCNGGIFALAPAVLEFPAASFAMAASIAISAADTWASEIGMGVRAVTRDILRWRKVPQGLSGGVSWQGTIGGTLGAVTFGILGSWISGAMDLFGTFTLTIATAGLGGMLLDSIIGSGLQPRYRTSEGRLSDNDPPGSQKLSGWGWMSNDMVNLLSNAVVTSITVILIESFLTDHHSILALF